MSLSTTPDEPIETNLIQLIDHRTKQADDKNHLHTRNTFQLNKERRDLFKDTQLLKTHQEQWNLNLQVSLKTSSNKKSKLKDQNHKQNTQWFEESEIFQSTNNKFSKSM